MQATSAPILGHMDALSEGVRSRLLLLLDQEELTVSDLCAVLQLPQSTVSRHLKTLLERGWIESRPNGTRRLYRATVASLEPAAQRLWELTRPEVEASSGGKADRERLRSVMARQRTRTQEFFEASGERWDTLRDELFGDRFLLQATMGMLPASWRVADLGCGTGTVVEAFAPFVRNVIGIDSSEAMLEIARERVERFENISLKFGELESLPIGNAELDATTMMLVLHHLEHPERAINEAARCLRPGGRIVIVDMLPHDRAEYQQEMGHTWLGFSQDTMTDYLDGAGFGAVRFSVLPPVPEARGPNLFALSADKKE